MASDKMMIRTRQNRNPRNFANELFQKLTRLFSGPLVNYRKQTEKALRQKSLNKYASRFRSTSGQQFRRSQYNPFEQLNTSLMINHQRAQRYADFSQMEFNPDIASALDVYADEITYFSHLDPMLKINCSNEEIKEVLKVLYHDVMNANFNLFGWTRTLCKYGDFFLYLDIDEEDGVKNIIGLPSEEIERIEGEDKDNPNYVQFQWNASQMTFENWQVAHFRILGQDKFWPYGTSILDPARRIWRQLTLLEDAMMAYRIVRSPERKVFYIDVGNIPPEDVEQYVQKVITSMKRNQIVDADSGHVDLRYNPMCYPMNSRIYLCNGETESIKNLSDQWKNKNKDVYVWSLDQNSHVIPTKLLWVGKTRENAEFLEIELDDGQKFKTTPDHNWMLRSGEKIKAQNLKVGDSLMPFYMKVNKSITKRHGDFDNFYTSVYDPGYRKYISTHKLVANWKYGSYQYPDIIHHKDHCKFNNDPNNLEKMLNSNHAQMHEENVKKLNEYAISDKGREISRATFIKTHKENDFSEISKQLWKNKKIRQKRIDSLTLKTDSTLIMFVCRIINKLGTESREYIIRECLNNDPEFKQYLKDLNPNYKNGFNDHLTKNQFRYALRKNNFKNLRKVKNFVIAIKAPWDKIVDFAKNCVSRNDISKYFNIRRYDLICLIKEHKITKEEFDQKYLKGGYFGREKKIVCEMCQKDFSIYDFEKNDRRFCSQECYWDWMKGKNWGIIRNNDKQENIILNHKIVSIKRCEETEDAYGVTVESSLHCLAIGSENYPKLRNSNVPMSGIQSFQSVEEDFFIPVRGASSTKIESLPGGSYTGDIDDVKYLRDKLFAALKVPMSYLSRGEQGSEDKTSLAQKDIRFARTIQRIQRCVISELEKVGMIHLYILGFRGEDLLSFNLALNNPSKVADLQELSTWKTKFETAAAAVEGYFSRRYIAEKFFGLSSEEFLRNQREMYYDRMLDAQFESISTAGEEGGLGGGGGDLGSEITGGESSATEEASEEDDSMLLASPEKGGEAGGGDFSALQEKEEPHLTPGSKGKEYTYTDDDKRDEGARERKMKSYYSAELGSNTKRNVFKGIEGLLESKTPNYEEREEKSVKRNNKVLQQIVEGLENRKKKNE